jgi:hypothetical protein
MFILSMSLISKAFAPDNIFGRDAEASLQPADLLAPLSEQTKLSPSLRGFYIRAFGALVAPTAAAYHYNGNWASSTGRDLPIYTR